MDSNCAEVVHILVSDRALLCVIVILEDSGLRVLINPFAVLSFRFLGAFLCLGGAP